MDSPSELPPSSPKSSPWRKQGKRLGLNERALTSFIAWVVGIGFLGGHMLDVIFYYPGQVLHDPLSLFRIWEGLSSFGGFTDTSVPFPPGWSGFGNETSSPDAS